ncbi:MAG: HAD family hydrolase [Odoribacter sp.]
MQTKLIIFDLDGTLLNTLGDLAASVNYVLREHRFPEHPLSAYRFFVGNGITKLIERALPEEARQETTIQTLRQEFVAYYQQHKIVLTHPYRGIPEVLNHLNAHGILLAVASNKYHQGTVELIHHYFGTQLFTVIAGQQENVPVKPDPAIVHRIINETGIRTENTLYIGDSGVDMQTARNSNIPSIGVTWGFRPRRELEENGAGQIIDRPQEIISLLG